MNITYKDPTGKERLWEAAHRTTRLSSDAADAVCSIPILKRLLHYDSVILVKQYRPPMKAYTIEFPAGLLDPNETPEMCALRELKEETGYTGEAKHTSPPTALDPGLSNTTVQLVTVEIDGDLPENEKHAQKQDEGEFIEVLTIPLDGMLQKLNELASEGHVVDSRVYSYAVAREQQKNIKPTIT